MKLTQFKTKLSSIVKRLRTASEDIETLARVALTQFANHGDTSYIEMLVNQVKGTRVPRSGTLKDYIKNHANVVFKDNGQGDFKVTKKGKGPIEVNMPADQDRWYNFNNDGQATPDKEFPKLLQGVITTFEKAMENGKAKTSSDVDMLLAKVKSELVPIINLA